MMGQNQIADLLQQNLDEEQWMAQKLEQCEPELSRKAMAAEGMQTSGGMIAQGTPAEIRASSEPFVNQFVNGKLEGPVPFQYPASDYATDLEVLPA